MLMYIACFIGKGQAIATKIKEPAKKEAKRNLAGERVREMDGMIENDEEQGEEEETDPQADAGLFASNETLILGEKYPNSTETTVAHWQLENHDAFLLTFISCLRNGPI